MTATAPSTVWSGVETISAGGQELRVAHREGDGALPPLLLVPGFGCSIEVAEPTVAALRPGTGVVSFDPPGIGLSPSASRPYRLRWLATVLAGVLDRLGYSQVDVLGVSWGGALAQEFAHRQRARCRRLVLVSTGPAAVVRPSPTVLRELLEGRRFRPGEAQRVAPALYGGKVRTDPSLVGLVHRRVGGSPRGQLFQQLALLGWTSVPHLRSIRQPTLVLAGDDDPLVPMLNARIMRLLIPVSTLHVFHDGHLGLLTSADEVVPIIERFRHDDAPHG